MEDEDNGGVIAVVCFLIALLVVVTLAIVLV